MAWVDLRKDKVVSFDVRDGDLDQDSVRYVDPPMASDSSPAREGKRGSGNGVFIALGVATFIAALAAGRVVMRRRAARSS